MILIAIYATILEFTDFSSTVQSIGFTSIIPITLLVNRYVIIVTTTYKEKANAGNITAFDSVKLNKTIKMAHIPAYIFHFLLGIAGLFLSIWGIGFILWAIIIDLLTISISGSIAASACTCCEKEGLLSETASKKLKKSSYIFIEDVSVARALYNTIFENTD